MPVMTSTSNSFFSSSMPPSAIFSATSTFICLLPHEDGFGGDDAASALECVAKLGESHLETREHGDDVELAEVAEVTDAEDLARVVVLTAGDGDAVLVLEDAHDLLAVDALRHPDRRDRAAATFGRREQLEAESLTALAGGFGQHRVAGDRVLEALV